MPYDITIAKIFAASHAIRLPDGSLEPIHGHNWPVEVTVTAKKLDEIECVMDFHVLEKSVDALMAQLHNKHVNDVGPFVGTKVNPTAERIAWWIGAQVAKTLPRGVKLVSVRIGEAPGCFATYRP